MTLHTPKSGSRTEAVFQFAVLSGQLAVLSFCETPSCPSQGKESHGAVAFQFAVLSGRLAVLSFCETPSFPSQGKESHGAVAFQFAVLSGQLAVLSLRKPFPLSHRGRFSVCSFEWAVGSSIILRNPFLHLPESRNRTEEMNCGTRHLNGPGKCGDSFLRLLEVLLRPHEAALK